MQRTTLYPTDLTAPGAVEELLAWHRATFGDARMEVDADDDSDDVGDATDDDADDDDSGDDAKDDKDEPLGPAGVKALQAEKAKRREAQGQLREFKALGLTPEQIRALTSKKDDDGKDKTDADAIRETARTEARREAQLERVGDKIEAKASAFADPEDAVALVLRHRKPEDFLDADGKIDVEEIEDALKELLEKKPHLAAQGGKRFRGGGDGGARKDRKPKATSLEDAINARVTSS